jgi:hypothetical protein
MSEIFGQFIDPGQTPEYVVMSFSTITLPVQERWRNNSLSADFLAQYWETFLLSQDPTMHVYAAGIKDTVSYVANELLENSAKFHDNGPGVPIQLSVYQVRQHLRFYVGNCISNTAASTFQKHIHTLLTEDLDDLYLRQIEQNASDEDNTESHLGLLTLANDYQVNLGWKFDPIENAPGFEFVTTMAELTMEERLC